MTSDVPAAGIITGIGRVGGPECMVVANDATVKGGTYYPLTVKKHLRAQEIARENRLPCVYLVDSGGANLPHQDEVFPDRDHFGRIFFNQARCRRRGIPQIARGDGHLHRGRRVRARDGGRERDRGSRDDFLAGPPLVKAATGEVVTAEELGGAEVHAASPALPTITPQDDAHALGIARRIVANLNRVKHATLDIAPPREPEYDPAELSGIVPVDARKPYDVREVIARIVDGSAFDEFKELYGATLVTGFARLHGIRSASWPTTASCSRSPRSRARISSSCAASAAFRSCSCRTSPASWWARSTRPAASPRTAPSW